MDKGYISLWRSIQDNEMWFEEPFTRAQAWIDLLLLANHKTTYMRVRGIRLEVERGQIGRSKETLADRWKWSRSKVMRFLDELENDGMIEQQTSIKNSRLPRIISIVNYEKYQQNEQQKDNKKTLNEQQKDTNNNVNKLNNENKDKNISKDIQKETNVSSEQIEYDSFLEYWNHYANEYGLAKIKSINTTRKTKIKARLKQDKDFAQNLGEAIQMIGSSDFLTGRNGNWKATFDWLIQNDTNYYKVLEGNYQNKGVSQGGASEQDSFRKQWNSLSSEDQAELERIARQQAREEREAKYRTTYQSGY